MAFSLLALCACAALTGCGGSSTQSKSGPTASKSTSTRLQGILLNPPRKAPSLSLRNYTGRPVSLAGERGKAVFVTFLYTHCPDVCPLIAAKLAAAQRMLGPQASHVSILAVTVDPKRDTPAAIRQFLAARDALGRMDYLLGSRHQLVRTWKDWDVAVSVDTNKVTAGHSALVYGISARGRVTVVLPANFSTSQVVHDAPLLAKA